MSDKLEITPENADNEAFSRAERIKAIKDALKKNAEEFPEDVSDDIPDIPEEVPADVNVAEKAEEEIPAEPESAKEAAEAVKPVSVADVIRSSQKETEAKTIAYKIPESAHEAPVSHEKLPEPVSKAPVSHEKIAEPVREAPISHEKIPDDKPVSGYTGAPVSPDAPVSGKPVKVPGKKKKKTIGHRIRGLFPEAGDSVLECVRKIVFLASVVAIVVCGYMVGDYYFDLWRNRLENDSIADLYDTYPVEDKNYPDRDPGERYYDMFMAARKLMDINPEVVGYIKIDDTPVDYPVVQADDNVKYLDLNFKGEESRAGSIYLDYRNHFDDVTDHHLNVENSGNLVVYGHNMGDDSMFGCLDNYQTIADYYEKHPIVKFNSNYNTYTYKIFSVFIVDADDETETKFDCWNKLDFSDEHDFYKFVNETKRRSLRWNDVDVKYGDQLLTLFTCNDFLRDRGRLIVMARLVRSGEGLLDGVKNNVANPNIKWPTMYYNTKTNEKYDPEAEFFPYGPEK